MLYLRYTVSYGAQTFKQTFPWVKIHKGPLPVWILPQIISVRPFLHCLRFVRSLLNSPLPARRCHPTKGCSHLEINEIIPQIVELKDENDRERIFGELINYYSKDIDPEVRRNETISIQLKAGERLALLFFNTLGH